MPTRTKIIATTAIKIGFLYLVKNASEIVRASLEAACSFLFAIIILFLFIQFKRGKITEIISDIEIYSLLFSFFINKTFNIAQKKRTIANDS